MYIKKSIISGTVMVMGVFLLTIMAILFCFTEVRIPVYVSIVIWITCILAVVEVVGKIESR